MIHIFWAAKALGSYTASAITFFIPVSLYNLEPDAVPRTSTQRLIITAGFPFVVYGVFAMLLKVFTPREVFLNRKGDNNTLGRTK